LIFKKAGNDYKKLPYHLGPHNFCEYWKTSIFYDDLLESSDIPPKGECPWPKRKYTVHGFRMPTEKVPPFVDGDVMIELRLLQKGELLNGFRIFVTVIRF
jgi:hypothetical protein